MLSRIPNSTLTHHASPRVNTNRINQSPTFSGMARTDSFQKSSPLKFRGDDDRALVKWHPQDADDDNSKALIKRGNLDVQVAEPVCSPGVMRLWKDPRGIEGMVVRCSFPPEKIIRNGGPNNLSTVLVEFKDKRIKSEWCHLMQEPEDFSNGMKLDPDPYKIFER